MVSSELIRLIKVAALSAGGTLFIVNDLGLIAKIEGSSMQPTFNPYCGQKNEALKTLMSSSDKSRELLKNELKTRLQQDRVILNKWRIKDKRKDLRIGDVVILISPRDPTKTLIKRISAMPGDLLHLIETNETKLIDEGHCWVEGDNQASSYDSNTFGQVPLGLIEGKVCYIVWPLNRIQAINCDPNISMMSSKTILLNNNQETSNKLSEINT